MLNIPGVTSPAKNMEANGDAQDIKEEHEKSEKVSAEDAQFQMDI